MTGILRGKAPILPKTLALLYIKVKIDIFYKIKIFSCHVIQGRVCRETNI